MCGQPTDSVFLLLVGGGLRIVHVKRHRGVRTALDRLHTDLIVRAARAGALARTRLGAASPRIAMFGINLHASEGELFGPEEEHMVVPAVEKLRAAGYRVSNPTGADTLLSEGGHDLYVAIFHDQGHTPSSCCAKGRQRAVVGSGVLLCSVGHGSAMDIAGQGIAEPDAVLRSIHLVSAGTFAP